MYNQINKVLYLGAIIALLSTSLFVSCQSKTDKQNEEVTEQTTSESKTSDWTMFKDGAEKTIASNDERIKVLKEKINKPGTPNLDKLRQNRIDALQEENTNLRSKILEYKADEANSDWQKFKLDVQQQLDKISQEFDDLNK